MMPAPTSNTTRIARAITIPPEEAVAWGIRGIGSPLLEDACTRKWVRVEPGSRTELGLVRITSGDRRRDEK